MKTAGWADGLTTASRRALHGVAIGSLVAGVVHLGVCPEHFREATSFGVFFVIAATLQLVWSGAVASKPTPRVLVTGAVLQLGTAAVWLASRTTGLPIGP